MTVDQIFSLIKKFFDVLIVWFVFYYVLRNLRKNVKMALLFKGILFIFILKILSDIFDLSTLGYLLNYVMLYFAKLPHKEPVP